MEIIAEIGQNHNGNIELALELINEAKANGADVAKFQKRNSIDPMEISINQVIYGSKQTLRTH